MKTPTPDTEGPLRRAAASTWQTRDRIAHLWSTPATRPALRFAVTEAGEVVRELLMHSFLLAVAESTQEVPLTSLHAAFAAATRALDYGALRPDPAFNRNTQRDDYAARFRAEVADCAFMLITALPREYTYPDARTVRHVVLIHYPPAMSAVDVMEYLCYYTSAAFTEPFMLSSLDTALLAAVRLVPDLDVAVTERLNRIAARVTAAAQAQEGVTA